jgi:hypothetical protein
MSIKKRRSHADFESVEKVLKKMHPKKVISKNVTEICTFFTFTYVPQTCFACNFFLVHFFNFFNGFEISVKFCGFFYIFFDLKKKKKIGVLLALWSQMPN